MLEGHFNELFERTKQLSKRFRVKEQGYKPYTGGTGPSEEQIEQNNLALKKFLAAEGIETEVVMTDFDGATDIPVQVLQVTPEYTVGYDRWGFVGEPRVEGDELDQGNLDDAMDWVRRRVHAS